MAYQEAIFINTQLASKYKILRNKFINACKEINYRKKENLSNSYGNAELIKSNLKVRKI